MTDLFDGLVTLEKQMASVFDFYKDMVNENDLNSGVKARMKLSEISKQAKTLRAMFLREQTRLADLKKTKRNYKKCLRDIRLGYVKV